MSTIASAPVNNSNLLLRSIALGGLIIGTLHLIIQHFLFFSLLGKVPFTTVEQYIASAALGNAAFEGGLVTVLLGVFFHYLTSFVIAAIFIMSATRIPMLRRNIIVGSLLFGFAAFVVMNFIVLPLSAAPKVDGTLFGLIELIIEHALIIGLPLGIILRWNTNVK
jgi:hypothetical protein